MNPYEVLGVSENADEETIKKAYKDLVKKYHPDKYVNNPLADLAAEKMKEINKAYDMISKHKGEPHTSSSGSGGAYGTYNTYGSYSNVKPTFALVRQLIAMRQPTRALHLLQQMEHTAEWYFLSGVANINRGWYDQGLQHLEEAVRREPNNTEYRDTLDRVKNGAGEYKAGEAMFSSGGSCCTGLPCYCLPCCCPGICC